MISEDYYPCGWVCGSPCGNGAVRQCLHTLALTLAGLLLPYPTANLVLDVVMLLLYLGIEVIRLFFGECHSENISTAYETCWSL